MGKAKKVVIGGKTEGLNAWKKSLEVQPEISVKNPTLTIKCYMETYTEVYITSNVINFTKIEDFMAFLDGFSAASGASYPKIVKGYTGGYIVRIDFNSGYTVYVEKINVNSASKITLVLQSGYSWNGYDTNYALSYTGVKKIQSQILETAGFVVNDDASKYPSGAMHTDGYWYDLIGQVSAANAYGLNDALLETIKDDTVDEITAEVVNNGKM